MNALRHNKAPALAVLGLAGSLALSGCSGREDSGGPTTPKASTTSSEAGKTPHIRFDDLGGGSSRIKTYRGPGKSADDRQESGSAYNVGDVEPVECYTVGRPVSSDPSVGEEKALSYIWYRLHKAEFATAVYADLEPANAHIREC